MLDDDEEEVEEEEKEEDKNHGTEEHKHEQSQSQSHDMEQYEDHKEHHQHHEGPVLKHTRKQQHHRQHVDDLEMEEGQVDDTHTPLFKQMSILLDEIQFGMTSPCHVMLCYVILCHVRLCHVMSCHVLSGDTEIKSIGDGCDVHATFRIPSPPHSYPHPHDDHLIITIPDPLRVPPIKHNIHIPVHDIAGFMWNQQVGTPVLLSLLWLLLLLWLWLFFTWSQVASCLGWSAHHVLYVLDQASQPHTNHTK